MKLIKVHSLGEIIFDIIALLITVHVLYLMVYSVYNSYKHPCIKGHYEQQWITDYIYDSSGNMIPCGGHFEEVFICDERK